MASQRTSAKGKELWKVAATKTLPTAKVRPSRAPNYIPDEDLMNLAKEIAPNWEKAATKLGFNERGIEMVRAKCPSNPELQSFFALAYWRREAIEKNQIVAAQELLMATRAANGGQESETMTKVNNKKLKVEFIWGFSEIHRDFSMSIILNCDM